MFKIDFYFFLVRKKTANRHIYRNRTMFQGYHSLIKFFDIGVLENAYFSRWQHVQAKKGVLSLERDV